MYEIIVDVHSVLRYLALLFVILLILQSIKGTVSKNVFTPENRKLTLFTMIAFHMQLLLGIILYFTSPKVIFDTMTMKSALLRFFALEHPLIMVVSVILVTLAYIRIKNKDTYTAHRILLIYSIVVFILLMAGIPWPFRENLGAGWI